MLVIKVNGANKDLRDRLLIEKNSLIPRLKEITAINFINSEVLLGFGNQSAPYVEVHGSRETNLDDLIHIANHFLPLIDIELYPPRGGGFVFRERGKTFRPEDFAE